MLTNRVRLLSVKSGKYKKQKTKNTTYNNNGHVTCKEPWLNPRGAAYAKEIYTYLFHYVYLSLGHV